MSSDSYRGSGSQDVSDAHTDPLLPKITDEMLAAGKPAPPSTLDDRTLAGLIAELEGDDQYALDELLAEDEAPPVPRPAAPRAHPKPPEPPAPRGEAVVGTERRVEPVAEPDRAASPKPVAVPQPPVPEFTAQPEQREPVARPRPVPPKMSRQAPPMQRPAPAAELEPPSRDTDDLLDEDDSYPVIRQSPLGPVVRSRYGDFRPPVEREQEAQTLTGFGLTRRSRTKLGSRLFTVVFVAIFLLILIQAMASVMSAPGH